MTSLAEHIETLEPRLARREGRAGIKISFTSRAKMRHVGVGGAAGGRISDGLTLKEGQANPRGIFAHAHLRPEIAFPMKAPLAGRAIAARAVTPVTVRSKGRTKE
ncbi:MAG: hypothetical protein H5U21_01210 [Porphyrobacter sp.]|nr:hypothetical protein [Porphyrobacter sp.]